MELQDFSYTTEAGTKVSDGPLVIAIDLSAGHYSKLKMDIGILTGYAPIRFKIGYLNNTTFTSLNVTDISGISSEIINTGELSTFNNDISTNYHVTGLDQTAGYTVEIEFEEKQLTSSDKFVIWFQALDDVDTYSGGVDPHLHWAIEEIYLYKKESTNTLVSGLFDVGNAIKNGTSQMFKISTSDTLPNNVKSLSFWIKDYECLNDNWLLESDLSGSNRMALTAGGTPENTLKIFGPNAKRIYIDGIEHTITGTTGYRTITPARQASYFSGWHHIYVSVIENLVDLEIASSNNTNHSSLTLDELRMYNRELTNYEIRNLYNNGPATNISNIENIKVVYEKNNNSIFNLKTITESVFQSFSRDGRGLLNIQKEHLTDLSDVSYNSLELTNKQLLQWDSSTDRWVPREAILPLLSKVDTILPNKIKLTFSEEIKQDTNYNLNNFIVKYDTFDLSCDKIDISNGDVIIETPIELNSNEILLSGTSSDLSNGQVYTDSGDAGTGHSASDLFDNSLSGKYISVNTVFSTTSPYGYTGTGDTAGYTGLWIQIDLSNASDYHVTKVRIYPSKPTDRHR